MSRTRIAEGYVPVPPRPPDGRRPNHSRARRCSGRAAGVSAAGRRTPAYVSGCGSSRLPVGRSRRPSIPGAGAALADTRPFMGIQHSAESRARADGRVSNHAREQRGSSRLFRSRIRRLPRRSACSRPAGALLGSSGVGGQSGERAADTEGRSRWFWRGRPLSTAGVQSRRDPHRGPRARAKPRALLHWLLRERFRKQSGDHGVTPRRCGDAGCSGKEEAVMLTAL